MAFRQRVQGLWFTLSFLVEKAGPAGCRAPLTVVGAAGSVRWGCFRVGPEGLDVAAHLCPRHGRYVFPEWQKPVRHCPWQNGTQT